MYIDMHYTYTHIYIRTHIYLSIYMHTYICNRGPTTCRRYTGRAEHFTSRVSPRLYVYQYIHTQLYDISISG